jgi:hypothetical protein
VTRIEQECAPWPRSPWHDAARTATAEVGRQALGAVVGFGDATELPAAVEGAIVPIVSDLAPIQIGLFSSARGCEALARALLGSTSEEVVSRAEIVDAVGEIVNMLTGNVKSRVARYATHAVLGLPTFVHGPLELQSRQAIDLVHAIVGETELFVVVLHPAR